VRLLLDTHVWLWAATQPENLGKKTRAVLVDQKTDRFVSAAAVLEIARLNAGGQVVLSTPPARWIEESSKILMLDHLPITTDIAVEAYSLPPPFHRDPADRLLVATARIHNLVLMTADERILRYHPVRTTDCRK
jgi:PIN domain nuclease of toxin-antitoxin system